MLPSSKRLTTPLFKEVMDKGKLVHSSFFSLKIMKATGESRFSVAVSKKIAKSAVERNKIRRRSYSAIRMVLPRLPEGIHGVFMAKAPILKSTLPDISKEVELIFVKSGLLK